jgi:hypothetical protein
VPGGWFGNRHSDHRVAEAGAEGNLAHTAIGRGDPFALTRFRCSRFHLLVLLEGCGLWGPGSARPRCATGMGFSAPGPWSSSVTMSELVYDISQARHWRTHRPGPAPR